MLVCARLLCNFSARYMNELKPRTTYQVRASASEFKLDTAFRDEWTYRSRKASETSTSLPQGEEGEDGVRGTDFTGSYMASFPGNVERRIRLQLWGAGGALAPMARNRKPTQTVEFVATPRSGAFQRTACYRDFLLGCSGETYGWLHQGQAEAECEVDSTDDVQYPFCGRKATGGGDDDDFVELGYGLGGGNGDSIEVDSCIEIPGLSR